MHFINCLFMHCFYDRENGNKKWKSALIKGSGYLIELVLQCCNISGLPNHELGLDTITPSVIKCI